MSRGYSGTGVAVRWLVRMVLLFGIQMWTFTASALPPRVLIQSQHGTYQKGLQALCRNPGQLQPVSEDLLVLANSGQTKTLTHCVANTPSAQCTADIQAACAPPVVVAAAGGAATTVTTPTVSWQTAAVQGLASFLQQRATDEVAAWLLQDVFNRFCTDTFSVGKGKIEAKTLFPKTCALSATTVGYGVSASLAAALRSDIEGLPSTVAVEFLDALFPGTKALITPVLGAAITAFEQIRAGVPPLEALAAWSQDPNLTAACPAKTPSPNSVACAMRTVGTLLMWAGDALKDPNAAPDPDMVATLRAQLNAFCAGLNGCTQLAAADDAQLSSVLSRTQTLYATIKGWQPSAPSPELEISQTINLIVDVGDAAAPLLTKMFNLNLLTALGSSTYTRWSLTEDALHATAEGIAGQGPEAARDTVLLLNKVVSLNTDLMKVDPALQAVISLAADLAAAKDAQGVQAALQAATAPIGSWRYKHQRAAIGLGAYVGITGGLEFPTSGSLTANPPNGFFGAFAAVGIDFTAPTTGAHPWALGVFVSVLDVGQLLTFPVNPQSGQTTGSGVDTGKTAQPGGDINVLEVLSPGLYLHTSLGNTPFTLGVGASFAPLSRTYVDDASGTKTPFDMFRVNGFLAVDLNLLPFTH